MVACIAHGDTIEEIATTTRTVIKISVEEAEGYTHPVVLMSEIIRQIIVQLKKLFVQ
jgi:hypothetical protein